MKMTQFPRQLAWLAALGSLPVLAAIFFWPRHFSQDVSRPGAPPSTGKPDSRIATESTDSQNFPPDAARTTTLAPGADGRILWPGAAIASQQLNSADQSANEDLDVVRAVITDYHKVFGQVPEGGLNEEITRALGGDNPKHIVFLNPNKAALSASGELLDRWGTPYFFHKLSRNVIDLRSAGPDRNLWTPDDIFQENAATPPL
jgi:hypothetical protein